MPILPNPRHEAFAQALAKGKTADEAYALAGYKPHRGNASRLSANESVKDRVAELQAKVAKKVEVTVESLAGELEEARALALTEKQSSAAVQATMGKAKLFGFLIERHRHSGPNGGAIPTIDVTKLKGISDQELELLERALVQIGIVDGDPSREGGEEV
ncbi:MAG: terminase [Rhizobiales bacterium]|nr:terminase [Hyphomicrobiales bacterium]